MELLQFLTSSNIQSFIDNPEQLVTQPVGFQIAVANYPETPRHLLEVLVNSPDPQVAEAARLHVNWALEMNEGWQEAVDEMLRSRQLGQNDAIAVELLKIAPVPECFLSEWVPAERLIQGLRNPYMPMRYRLKLLERLAQEPTLEPRLQVAESPETPLAVLEQLAGDLELPVRLAVKFNPSCPPPLIELVEGQHTGAIDWNTDAEQLAMLGQSRWGWVRLAVAQNPAAPAQTLMQLATDAVFKIQLAVAKNPGTPLAVLVVLAEHSEQALQAAVAVHPNATEEILHQLFPTQQHLLRQRENLPVSILERFFSEAETDKPMQLASQPVEKTINNVPTVRETALKNPNFPPLERYRLLLAREEEQETALAHELMARRTDSPYALAQVLEKGERNARLTAARSHKTPIHVLEQLALDPDETIRQVVLQNPNLPLNSLMELARDSNFGVRIWLARSRHPISREVLEQLLQDSDARVRAEVASNTNTPPDLLRRLVEDRDRNVKISALQNPNIPSEVLSQVMPQIQEGEIERILRGQAGTGKRNSQMPADVLERLCRHPKDTIRYLVATYRTASIATLERLAFDKYGLVRETVAENPNTPPSVLIEMARRDELTTRVGCFHSVSNKIAMRKDAPPEALELIARKPVAPVRAVVAANENTPASALEWLAENETDEDVLCTIVRHPNMTPNNWMCLAGNEAVRVREATVAQVHCPSYILEMLADDSAQEVRLKVATNPSTPIHVVDRFARDENSAIRTAAASNPNLSTATLERLAQDEKVEVRRAVAQNPNTPAPIREALRDLVLQPTTRQTSPTLRSLSRLYNPSTDDLATVLSEYAQSDNAFVRLVTLLHPLTPGEVRKLGARSQSWLERYAVADNPATSFELRQRLAQDSNRIVRATAKAYL